MINAPIITPAEAIEAIVAGAPTGAAFVVWGAPGVGKSSLYEAVAKRIGGHVHIECPAYRMAVDYIGLPYPDEKANVTRNLRPDFLPTTPGPGVLGIDEIAGADPQVATALYGLMLERRIGNYTLPDGWIVIATSNRPEDKAISMDLGRAMNDRLVHLQVEVTPDAWLAWAVANDIHPIVCAFIKTCNEALSPTEKQLNDDAVILPSPRSWHRVSNILKASANAGHVRLTAPVQNLILGTVGEEVGSTFLGIAEELVKLPPIETLLAAAGTQAINDLIPSRMDLRYALCYAVGSALSAENVTKVFTLVNDLRAHGGATGGDFAALAGQLACKRANDLDLSIYDDSAFRAYNDAIAA